MRVMTWNVWWRFGPWQERQVAIGSVLADVDADVVCLQEVWSTEDGTDQVRSLADALGFHWCRTPERFHDGVSFGNAICSRWPMRESSSARLPGADGRPGHRRVLSAVVDAPFGPVPVHCTHFEYRFDESALRQRQAVALAERVAESRGDPETQFPAVVCGDFNAVPSSDEVRMLTGERPPPVPGLVFTDAWAAVGDGPGWTWDTANPYQGDAYWPRRRLDYVFVTWPRPKPVGNPVTARVVGHRPVDGVVASDHFGVVVDLHEPDETARARRDGTSAAP